MLARSKRMQIKPNSLIAKLISRRTSVAQILVDDVPYEANCVYFESEWWIVPSHLADYVNDVKHVELYTTVTIEGHVNLLPVTYAESTWRESALEALEASIDNPVCIKSDKAAQRYNFTIAKNITRADFAVPDDVAAFVENNISQITLRDFDDLTFKKLLKAQGGK